MSTKAVILLKCNTAVPNFTTEVVVPDLQTINVMSGPDIHTTYDESSLTRFVLAPGTSYVFIGKATIFTLEGSEIRGVRFDQD